MSSPSGGLLVTKNSSVSGPNHHPAGADSTATSVREGTGAATNELIISIKFNPLQDADDLCGDRRRGRALAASRQRAISNTNSGSTTITGRYGLFQT